MADVITLSSSDEEGGPARKKVKSIAAKTEYVKSSFKSNEEIVILSDTEDVTHSKTDTIKETDKENIITDDSDDCVHIEEFKDKIEVQERSNQVVTDISDICYTSKEVLIKESDKENVNDDSNDSAHTKEDNNKNIHKKQESSNQVVTSTTDNVAEKKYAPLVTINKQTDQELNKDASTSGPSLPSDLQDFLDVCEKSVTGTKYDKLKLKFHLLIKTFKKCSREHTDTFNFKSFLNDCKEKAKKTPAEAVLQFKDVLHRLTTVVSVEAVEVSEEDERKLKKLDRTIRKLVKVLKHLENQELDFENEENSVYIKIDRYSQRLKKVTEKYCELLKKNPNSGRISHERLVFVSSEYNEINSAISKKYKNNEKFPTYLDIEDCVRKCVNQHKLPLTESRIKSESAHCFEKLGELLQQRRKRELFDMHLDLIRDTNDPAGSDHDLNAKLHVNVVEGKKKIDALCQKYVRLQEDGVTTMEESDDSDDSNYVDSEPEVEAVT